MNWRTKWGILWTLAHLPGGRSLHEWLLRRHGELAHLEDSSRFRNAVEIVRVIRQHGGPLSRLNIVELGTGWVPAAPVAFASCGACVKTFDVQRLTDARLLHRSITELLRISDAIAQAAGIPASDVERRLKEMQSASSLDQALKKFGGGYSAPADTCRLPLDDGSVDVVMSSLVMQCIPAHIIPAVLGETSRVLGPDGIAVHRMRMTDEYATVDAQRNHFEYLKYSPTTWNRWFNHRIKHQNRLRASQFMRLFDAAGFDCVERQLAVDHESIRHLKEVGVDPYFAGCDWNDLTTVGMSVVLRKRTPREAVVSTKPRKEHRDHVALALGQRQ